ncbi:MAG: glycosyltransferase [Candidatus Azobacteroides sp.]|nr:glycosyltransferase [Candidatus Azobacteroides sp.]
MKVSLIIPTLNAEKEIGRLLEALYNQTVLLDEIIVIDSQSDDDTERICRLYEKVRFITIERGDFDHGRTRDYAFRQSAGDFVLFLTQDAIPVDEYYVEQILKPFCDESVALASGRQIAKSDAGCIEKWVRLFNYPVTDNIRTIQDIPALGIKTFFASNVCSVYRRSAYLQIGGFEYPILTDEDLQIAARFIYGGYKVAYCAEAKVFHSHNFSLKQHFRRNFDIAVFMRMHSHLFRDAHAAKEGVRMVEYVFIRLVKDKHFLQALYFCCECGVKFSAHQLGSHYRKLSRQIILNCSANKNFWKRSE